ncbi:hypothetical protein MVI01_51970 [Myxococcus virescens]|uniref:Alkyl hydroperoxide reductase subunit C/ Thiol specific antioxidant domain-containing protein n=2 Tax=Myxococcaceae TaxID=31 RepID=A0A511HIL3_9BACT|nr:hypothetical protein MVI01_51970 [Myxococcus virescens]SDE89020.1 hypothetical protein SAMN04488504_11457 [Myxococcus virescens]
MRRLLCFPLLIALALMQGACDRNDRYDRPGTPVPETLRAETLAGERIDRAALLGRPWVINVWAPG